MARYHGRFDFVLLVEPAPGEHALPILRLPQLSYLSNIGGLFIARSGQVDEVAGLIFTPLHNEPLVEFTPSGFIQLAPANPLYWIRIKLG